MKKVYRITESELINIIKESLITEQTTQDVINIQNALKALGKPYSTLLGTSGKNGDGVDGVYGKNTRKAVQEFQRNNKDKKGNPLNPDGVVGDLTAGALGITLGSTVGQVGDKVGKQSGQTTTEDDPDCIGPTQVCQQSTSKRETKPIPAGTDGCAKWARIQLEKKGVNISGNAWEWAGKLRSGLKYNMYTDGVNWNNIYNKLKNNGITMYDCKDCLVDDADKSGNKCGTIGRIIADSMPASSAVSAGNLKVGDAVGMYHSSSANKSFAFCTKAMGGAVPKDSEGYLKPSSSDHFTFNSHVGYVGAIKNGTPIIFHNVHGTVHATPVHNLTSKGGADMITWVASTSASKESGGSKSSGSWMDRYANNPYARRHGGGLD